jgi:hypothetical protein
LEFRYTNVEQIVATAGAGGILSFHTADGVAVVERWVLHVPEIVHEESRDPRITAVPQTRIGALRDIGALITTAAWLDGAGWTTRVAEIRGRLVRKDGHTPVVHGLVWLVATDDTARTDANGGFALRRVFPGPYTMLAADSVIAPTGIDEHTSMRIEVDTTRVDEVTLEMPELDLFLRDLCPTGRNDARGELVVAHVEAPDGSPAANAAFRADEARPDPRVLVRDRWRAKGTAESDGTFHLCNVPPERPIVITTWLDQQSLMSVDTLVPRNPPAEAVRIVLRPNASLR